MAEVILDSSNFDTEIKSTPIVVVDFWAPWCGPCQMMGPIIEEISNEVDVAKVKIAKLNVDENQEIAGRYGIMSIPTMLIYKEGVVVDKIVGAVPKERVLEAINRQLEN